jgi:hypothetical protein
MDGVENIGFPRPIEANKAVQLSAEVEMTLFVIFELDKIKRLQIHGWGNYFGGSLIFRDGCLYLKSKNSTF